MGSGLGEGLGFHPDRPSLAGEGLGGLERLKGALRDLTIRGSWQAPAGGEGGWIGELDE